LKPHHHAVLSF